MISLKQLFKTKIYRFQILKASNNAVYYHKLMIK